MALLAVALPAQESPAQRPEEVVKLDTFKVSTTLGKYAEVTSSSATKFPVDVKDIPSTVQVMNAAFIDDINAETLGDIYPYVVGMSQNSTAINDFNLRGFSSTGGGPSNLHSIQFDGLPGLTSRHGSPGASNVDRVEVLRGPASLLYGRIQPGGLINVVTKRPQAKQQVTVSGSMMTYDGYTSNFGVDNGYTVTVDATGAIDAQAHSMYRLIVNREDINSFRNYVGDDNWFIYPSYTYRWSADTSLTLQMEISREKHLFDSVLVAPFNNIDNLPAYNTTYQEPTDMEFDNGVAGSVFFKHVFHNGWTLEASTRSTFQAAARQMLVQNTLNSVLPVENSTVVRVLQHIKNQNHYDFGDVHVSGNLGEGFLKHTILLGASYGDQSQDQNRFGFGNKVPAINVYNPVIGVTPYPPDGTGLNHVGIQGTDYGMYASDYLKFGDHWRALAGIRWDGSKNTNTDLITGRINKQDGSKGLPQLGLIYDTGSVSLYGSYAGSYFPNTLTAYDANNNSNFPPLTATQVEVGAKSDFRDHTVSVSLAAYKIHMKNVLEATTAFTAQGNPISILSGAQETRGLELQGSWLPVPNWQFSLGSSYMPFAKTLESTNPALVGLRLANNPKFQNSFWTRYNVPDGRLRGLGVGLGIINQSGRSSGTSAATFISSPGYTRVNPSLYFKWRNYSVSLSVQNLLQQKHILALASPIKVVPGEPRKIVFSLKTSF